MRQPTHDIRLLLDTHTFFWFRDDPSSLSLQARALLANTSLDILVSAASAWEVAIKVRKGRWPAAVRLEANFVGDVTSSGFRLLDMTAEQSLMAGRLAGNHKDPFDRMLAAQALLLDVPILSADTMLDQFGVRRIW